jgi:hypothetical protein
MTARMASPAHRATTLKPMVSNSDWKLWLVNTKSKSPRAIIALVSCTVRPILSWSDTPLTVPV